MELHSLLMFAAAYLAVVVLPGPSVGALVARVLSRGTLGAPSFIAGIAAGALVRINDVEVRFVAAAVVVHPHFLL